MRRFIRRHKIISGIAGALVAFAGGFAVAAWLVNFSGQGYVRATTLQALQPVDISATVNAEMKPDAVSRPIYFEVSNPNTTSLTVTNLIKTGNPDKADLTSDPVGCTVNNFQYTGPGGNIPLSVSVPAGGTATFQIADAARMPATAPTACQGVWARYDFTATAST
jgi:hypothetical protein